MSKKKIHRAGSFNTVTSCISVSLVLVVLGIVVFLACIAQTVTRSTLENLSIQVLVDDSLSNKELLAMEKFLRQQTPVKITSYTSKAQATRDMADVLGEDAQTFIGSSPFPASFELHLKAEYANNDSLSRLLPKLQEHKGIMDVIYPSELVDNVNNNMQKVAIILLAIAALLCVISISLINNTMKFSAYAHRYSIHTMKLVGAKWNFIRGPFMRNAFWMGFASACIASIVLLGIMKVLMLWDANIQNLFTTNTLIVTFSSVFVIGILMTTICALVSVNRFLRLRGNKVFLQ